MKTHNKTVYIKHDNLSSYHENKIERIHRHNKCNPTMNSTYDMEDCIQDDSTMEEKLEHLEDFDNETQLELLHYEMEHIMMHGIQPCESWYEERMNHIQAYADIDWKDLAARSYQRDNKMYEVAMNIMDHIEQLEIEWSSSPVFNLCVYQRLIEMIRSAWKYYSDEYYVTDVTKTVDILDLMNSMDNM